MDAEIEPKTSESDTVDQADQSPPAIPQEKSLYAKAEPLALDSSPPNPEFAHPPQQLWPEPAHEPVPTAVHDGDDDDFGDFGEAPVSENVTKTNADFDDDDEFGDFDDGVGSGGAVAEPEHAPIMISEHPVESEEDKMLGETLRLLTSDTPVEQTTLRSTLDTLIADAFPIVDDRSTLELEQLAMVPCEELLVEESEEIVHAHGAGAIPGKSGKLILPNPCFKGQGWYELWNHLASETDFSTDQTTIAKFRWKKSVIRKLFLEALDVPVLDEPTAGVTETSTSKTQHANTAVQATTTAANGGIGINVTASSKEDPRDVEMQTARALCEITEDELRQKSADELQTLIRELGSYTSRMQEHANYWLDAKEQLVMDAEMHNKMIASLVNYAQQLQVAGPKAKAAAAKKGGAKKAGSRR
ncbi:hypothetical protein BJ742DRAFT_799448 [Cladochytrium replicatum]|nr:hypothetical protein BJ742DRAFT_799448 [Cladochytrium replicatum]